MKEENIKWQRHSANLYYIFDDVAGNIDDILIFADKTEENTKSVETIVAELNKLFKEE